MASSDLHQIFDALAAFGSRDTAVGLDGRGFTKLFKDCGLLCKKFTATDCDLIFAKVKGKGMKKISFGQFEEALELAAEKKGVAVTELHDSIRKAGAGGPKSSGTKAEHMKFFDDKSLFTGVHAHGGPTTVDGNKNLSELCNRSVADVRGVSKTLGKQH